MATGGACAANSREDAIPVTGDSLRHSLGWQGRGITNLPSASCMLRLHLTNATIYALKIQR